MNKALVNFGRLGVEITPKMLSQLRTNVQEFEAYTDGNRDHPSALGGIALGVHKIIFSTNFEARLFEIAGVDPMDIRKASLDIPELNVGVVVRSTYNQLSSWLIYLILNAHDVSTPDRRMEAAVDVMKMVNYRFFTSLIFNSFRYVDEAIMRSTEVSLSGSLNVKKYGSWKASLENRAKDAVGPNSIHQGMLLTYAPDKAVQYFISDSQSRVRDYVKVVATKYYDLKEANQEGIKLYSSTMELDGEKLLKNFEDTTNTMSRGVAGDVLNAASFIDDESIQKITAYVGNFRSDMFRSLLIYFHDQAVGQSRAGKYYQFTMRSNKKVYNGIGALVKDMMRVMYRYMEKTDMSFRDKSRFRTNVIVNTRNAFSASRISEEDILVIKDALSKIVDESRVTTRDSTKTSLRTALVIYLMVKSFKYL